jgi:DNA-binding HxlR family transcriptional regulator
MSFNRGKPKRERAEDGSTAPFRTDETVQQRLFALSELLGRKWQPLILYHLFAKESLGFSELRRDIDGIAAKVLSENLSELTERELVDRTVIDEQPLRVEYTPTGRAARLKPVLAAAIECDIQTAQTANAEAYADGDD